METNFKVDVPSFALGYSAGKKKGGSGGGGAELNIAYGDTPPEDTSSLWVPVSKAKNVVVSTEVPTGQAIKEGSGSAGSIKDSCRLCKTCCARVGEYVYAFGGHKYSSIMSTQNTNGVFKFKQSSASQISGLSLPVSAGEMCCAAVGTKIYVFVCNDRTEIVRFDTADETLTTLEEALPKAEKNLFCTTVGTKIYLFGGYRDTESIIYCFDAETEKITQLSATLKKRCWLAGCAAIGTKIYILGGYNAVDGALDSIQCFNTENEEASILSAKLPSAKYGAGCTTIGNAVVLFGGTAGLDGTKYIAKKTIDVFYPDMNFIRTAMFSVSASIWASIAPHPSKDGAAISVGGCGADTSSSNREQAVTNDMQIYISAKEIELAKDTLYICHTQALTPSGNAFPLLRGAGFEITVKPYFAFKGFKNNIGLQVGVLQFVDGEWKVVV